MKAYYKGNEVEFSGTNSGLEKEPIKREWVTLYPEFEKGYYWSTSGEKKVLTLETIEPWHTTCKEPLPIGKATQIRFTLQRRHTYLSDYAQIVLFDEDMNVLLEKHDVYYRPEILNYVDVPQGAKYIAFNVSYNAGTIVQMYTEEFEQTPLNNADIRNRFLSDIEYANRGYKKKEFKPNDKAYIIFREDDTNPSIDLTYQLFKNNGIPIVFSTIPDKLYGCRCTGTPEHPTTLEVLKNAEASGMEVAVHGNHPITINNMNNFEYVYNAVVGNKKIINQVYGLNASGYVNVGGTDEFGASMGKESGAYVQSWANYLYDYTDGFVSDGWNLGTRINTKEKDEFVRQFKAKVNDVIEKKETVWFLFHYLLPKYNEQLSQNDAGYAPYEAMKECIEWCATLDKSQVEFTTYRDYMNSYYYNQ